MTATTMTLLKTNVDFRRAQPEKNHALVPSIKRNNEETAAEILI